MYLSGNVLVYIWQNNAFFVQRNADHDTILNYNKSFTFIPGTADNKDRPRDACVQVQGCVSRGSQWMTKHSSQYPEHTGSQRPRVTPKPADWSLRGPHYAGLKQHRMGLRQCLVLILLSCHCVPTLKAHRTQCTLETSHA